VNLIVVAQVAQEMANPTNPTNVLFQYGLAGVIIAWFMFEHKSFGKDIRTLSHRIDGLTRAMLVDALSRENIGPMARKFAQEMLAKIEASNDKK